jgi:aldose 1-epimerase
MKQNKQSLCTIDTQSFGLIDGESATLWTLANRDGMQVSIMDFGAIITSIVILDRDNKPVECVLGFDSAEDYASTCYRTNNPHLGAVIGRHAGRISYARAQLNQKVFQLTPNLGEHHMHGGYTGFDQKWWSVSATCADEHAASVTLQLFSADGEEGYPGNLNVQVCYTLTANNELNVDFSAQSDQDTFINLTQHSYFNLALHENTVSEHQLWLLPQEVIVTDKDMMPTGTIAKASAALDFHSARPIANSIIDTAYVLPPHSANNIIARLSAPDTGLSMDVKTDAPVMVVYNAQNLPEQQVPQRKSLRPFAAICFEPQGYTDAPNQPAFPNNILRAGTKFKQHITYIFSRDPIQPIIS